MSRSGILSLNADPLPEGPHIGRFLSQGAAVGMLLGFHVIIRIICHRKEVVLSRALGGFRFLPLEEYCK